MKLLDNLTLLKGAKQKKSAGGKTPEGKVKAQIRDLLDKYGAYTVMPATWGFGASGVPDFLVCFQGKFIGIEAKSNKTTHPLTKIQQRNLQNIAKAGGIALVVDEDSITDLNNLLDKLRYDSIK